MGASSVKTFKPNAPLTVQTLSDLATSLQEQLAPPSSNAKGASLPPDGGVPTTTTSTTTGGTSSGAATMASLDHKLVSSLGLLPQAKEFTKAAVAAGLTVPKRFGTEVVARLLGLRINHPAAQDYLELRPQDTATRAEAAYSAAQILGFGYLADSWQIAQVKQLAATISLPSLTPWQTADPRRRRLEDRDAVRLGRNERRHRDRVRRHVARRLRLLRLRLARLQAAELRRRRRPRLGHPGADDVPDERRGAQVAADLVREAPAGRRHLLRRERAEVDGRPRSSTRASTSATAGSSTRPTRASPSRSSPAGTAPSSRGAAGRCARRALEQSDPAPAPGHRSPQSESPSSYPLRVIPRFSKAPHNGS